MFFLRHCSTLRGYRPVLVKNEVAPFSKNSHPREGIKLYRLTKIGRNPENVVGGATEQETQHAQITQIRGH